MSTRGVGKNVFQLAGLLETSLQLEPWRRMKDKLQWPLTKVVMLTSYLFSFLHKKYKLLYINCYRHNKGNSITVSPRSQVSRTSSGAASGPSESRGTDDGTKRRRLSSAKHGPESSTSSDESLSAPPCVVTFNTGVKIVSVAAGGRHTLALSGNLDLTLWQ